MSFTVADLHDLIQLLEREPAWLTDVRRVVLTKELLALPEQLATLTSQVTTLTETLQTLTGHVNLLRGESLEQRYRTKGPSYFGRLLRGTHVLSSDEVVSVVEAAEAQGLLTAAETQDIYEADVIVRGRRREDGLAVYLVVEVSVGVGPYDVERAARRAQLLARTGVTTLPVVAGTWVIPEGTEAARAHRVWQITDGRVIAPPSAS